MRRGGEEKKKKSPLDVDESGFFTFPPGASRADLREEGQSMFEVAQVAGDSQARFRCALFIFFFFFISSFFFPLVQFAALAKVQVIRGS